MNLNASLPPRLLLPPIDSTTPLTLTPTNTHHFPSDLLSQHPCPLKLALKNQIRSVPLQQTIIRQNPHVIRTDLNLTPANSTHTAKTSLTIPNITRTTTRTRISCILSCEVPCCAEIEPGEACACSHAHSVVGVLV